MRPKGHHCPKKKKIYNRERKGIPFVFATEEGIKGNPSLYLHCSYVRPKN